MLLFVQNILQYSQTCANDHLWTTTTCQQRPAWRINDQLESSLPLIFSNTPLHNGHVFQVPRVVVVHRFDCISKILNKNLPKIFFLLSLGFVRTTICWTALKKLLLKNVSTNTDFTAPTVDIPSKLLFTLYRLWLICFYFLDITLIWIYAEKVLTKMFPYIKLIEIDKNNDFLH